MNTIWTTVVPETFALGESPVWDAANNRLYWVDILPGILHWFNFSDQTKHQLDVGQKIGSVALAGTDLLVAAMEKGFYYINISKRTISRVAEAKNEVETNRFNDGKCDAAGRFWAGTMSETGVQNAGKLYMLNTDYELEERLFGVGCSNGLAWSADNRIMYYIDSLSYEVVAFDFDLSSGKISGKRTVIRFLPEQGIPDGMTIDTQGALWIAMWNAANISRFDPANGRLLGQIKLPVSQVSSCTFGGEMLSDLFVTTASVGLTARERAEQPLAGSIFRIQDIGFAGLHAKSFLSQRRR